MCIAMLIILDDFHWALIEEYYKQVFEMKGKLMLHTGNKESLNQYG